MIRSGTGGLAQLGERLPCTQEVSGSIPLSSTSFERRRKSCSDFLLRLVDDIVVLYNLVFCDNQFITVSISIDASISFVKHAHLHFVSCACFSCYYSHHWRYKSVMY